MSSARRFRWRRAWLMPLLACTFAPGVAADPSGREPMTLTVHADRPGPRVSPTLYGIFFEEINHAGDGGLYAELVRNRALVETDPRDGTPAAWSLRAEGQSRGRMALDQALPLNEANPRSLRLEITSVPSGQVSVVNDGYWGIPARRGAGYRLSLYARCSADFHAPLTVSLEGRSGQIYARATLPRLSGKWRRYERRLTATADDPAARLVLSAAAPGSVWLNVVSLFPIDTWKRRPNGLRADLAGKVNAIRPAFVRFPGGCYVEGNHLANAFRWKRSLGDSAVRPGHWNDNWGYYSTDGLGFHEYLQFCEDVGAEPLFVVNCGIAHRDVVPVAELGPWIQDALDAIEYANGPVTSRWGALRARNGHPGPFGLRTIEIGNENGMFGGFGGTREQYAERYRAFYDAIKTRYPEIRTIANVRVHHPMAMVDEHFYNGPGWFWSNMDRYDRYDRKGPRIYVGEYAVTQNCGHGNLRAALAEAAFMTGLERSSDIVEMASYAPLLVNVNDRRWNPDAIVFDATRSYGTPSYHVQRLFSGNRADVVLPLELGGAPELPSTGSIGLGTWRTQAEYKDLEVTQAGRTVYSDHFDRGAPTWHAVRGDWSVAEGAFRQSGEGDDRRAVLEEPLLRDAGDYTLHLQARKLGGAEGFLILFHTRDAENYTWWNVGGWGNREHGLEKSADGGKIQLGEHTPGRIETGRWYDIRVELQGHSIRCYLDGRLIHDVEERAVPSFAAVAGRSRTGNEIVLKAVNGSDSPVPAAIHLQGVAGVEPTANVLLLASGSLEDENSLDQPNLVSPRSTRVSGVSSRFVYTFPARSLTVLRLKVKRR